MAKHEPSLQELLSQIPDSYDEPQAKRPKLEVPAAPHPVRWQLMHMFSVEDHG